MSTDDDEYEYKISDTKVPTFSGDKEKWPFYRKKMESYLARLGLGDLLIKAYGDSIPKDKDPAPTDATKKKTAETIRRSVEK